jgi:hypothetical protein
MHFPHGTLKPELSTLLGSGTFYFALTLPTARCQQPCAPIGNRRNSERVGNPPQDDILPHGRIQWIYNHGNEKEATLCVLPACF